jgi:segregation and condensation protein A
MQEYTVKLNDFEGPMELLLELIEKEKLNISEISLAATCDQFLEYTKHFEEVDTIYLANFLVIAAKLILIKSKSLLPFLELTEEEEEGIDELRQKLEEFQKIKRGVQIIKNMEEKQNISYERSSGLKSVRIFLPPKNISKEHLCKIFSNIKFSSLDIEKPEEKKIEAIISFEEKLSEIKERMLKMKEGYFHDVTDKNSKVNIIIGFLAILELIKQRFMMAEQDDNFGNIKLKKL